MPVRHLRSLIALAALVALAPAARAQTQRVTRVGVVVAVHVNMPAADAALLGDQIGEGLRQSLVIDVVAGSQAARRLPPRGVGELCVARPECVVDTASRLDADQLLFLVVVKLGKRIQVEPTWTDATGTQSASRDTIVLEEGGPPAREAFAAAAARLLPGITARTDSPGQPVVPAPPAAGAEQPAGAPGPSSAAGSAADLAGPAPAPARRFRVHPGTWIAGGVALAALAGGVGFGLAARSAEDELEADGCGDTAVCAGPRIDSLERKMLLADVFYGTALVAAGAAVLIQLRWGGRAEPPPVSVGATSEGASLLLRTSF